MSDGRIDKHPVYGAAFTQQVFTAAATAAQEATLANISGLCEQVEVKINNTTNSITFTVALTDANGGTLLSEAGIAENGTTILSGLSNKSSQDADFNPFLVDGTITATITPSGAAGASTGIVDVIMYLR